MGGGGRADNECHQKSSAFKYIPCDQWRSQGSDAGCKRAVALGEGYRPLVR